jgi:hypothetical protein
VLARAGQQTLGELSTSIRRAAIALDPANAEQRRQTALADRAATRQALDDGMAELRLIHTADAIHALWTRIDAAARLLPTDDPRSRDQQRADLAIDAILTGIPHDSLPHLQGRRPTIQVAPHNNAITCKRHNTCKKPDAPFSYTINPDGSTT